MSNTNPDNVNLPVQRERVVRGLWRLQAQAERDAGALLLGLWGSDERDRGQGYLLRAALLGPARVLLLELPVPEDHPSFPSLSDLFPAAVRMERAVYDLLGLRSEDGGDTRPWLRHGDDVPGGFPLRRDFDAQTAWGGAPEHYAFVRVEGEGVHEIPVGPVHAGIIEPGHFRFSVVGEKVLRLEQRLGYVHKGIERRFTELDLADGRRLAARVSGDSAVAWSWAYCMALEALCGQAPPPRALALRALLLERERIANHLGDLGALGNDAGFGFGLTQFSRLKEDLLRLNAEAFGARYPMDAVVPGGVAQDLGADAVLRLRTQIDALRTQVEGLRGIYDEHAGVQDRFLTCGRVTPELAQRLGLVGLAARASGQARDLRCDIPTAPYADLQVRKAGSADGDVAARVDLRFDETLESLRLCDALLSALPDGEVLCALPDAPDGGFGLGMVEGWRGPVLVALEAGADGRVRRCHPQDPSWLNWPALEYAVIGNIVPDFPLINKSFNLSYSGHDL